MRVRTIAGLAVAIFATLTWLGLASQPAAVMACDAPAGELSRATLPGAALSREAGFQSSLAVDGVLAPGALGLPGEQITWIITLGNTGTAPGTDIILTDQVNDQLRIDSVEVERGEFAISGQVVVFNTPYIAPGEEVQMRVNTTLVQTPPDGSLKNHVTLSASGVDGAVEDEAAAEVFVPTGLPATGYPPTGQLPGTGGPSVLIVALVGLTAVSLVAGYVWWRGSVRRI